MRAAKMSKYRAVRTNGYASKKEAKRAGELKLLEQLGEISDLLKQVKYVLIPKDELGKEVSYTADFVYWDNGQQQTIVEDVKGFRTPVYKLKRRLMWHQYDIKIKET